MAYNSDGYIMIDFTEVDFRRTNQTIDGLYKRCVDVIGTNKFILVINANGRTPLPATCSFTNNQYVIDTCIYMFAISSNDNLFIRRNDVPASDIIDDDSVSVDQTWSSNKIDTELDGKAVIADNVIVNNKVWSSLNTVEMLAPIDTIINNPVTFNTSLSLPIVTCNVSFIASQSGSGTPSHTNPRSMIGVSLLDVVVNGSTICESLGNTYYGGVLGVVSGKLFITRQLIDLGSLTYTARGNSVFTSSKLTDAPEVKFDILCSEYEVKQVNSLEILSYDMVISSVPSYNKKIIMIRDTDHANDDATTFKTAMNGIQLVYKLATPIEVQLTPTQLSTIIGNNTISSDKGSLTVSYKALPIDLL